jgi:drug/metabolite transporter (DMT)-like permease
MSAYLGELAALATTVLFSASSTVNTLAGRKVGASVLNRSRLVLAIFWLILAHALLRIPFPLQASPERWFWLSLSGIVGLAIGDALLFQAFIWIGPRLSMLLMSLAPAIAAVLAWILLGEVLSIGQWAGMALTMFGIACVIMDRKGYSGNNHIDKEHYLTGLLYGLGAAAGQALGLVLAKRGIFGDFPALSGTLIRMLAAAFVLWGITIFRRQTAQTIHQAFDEPRAAWLILLGSVLGPFLGVTLSLYAVQNTEVGVASTLTALPPIILLPVGYFFFKERFGWQSVLGTLLAMVGVSLLFRL